MVAQRVVTSLAGHAFRAFRHVRWPALSRTLPSRPCTVLDVGCGTERWFTTRIAQAGYQVTGVDVQDGVLLPQLPYDSEAFDLVVCLEVLEHTTDPVRSLQELYRVAKRRLLVTVPREPWFTMWRLGWWVPDHLWALTPTGCQRLLGPAQVTAVGLGRYWQLVWDKSSRASSQPSASVEIR